MPKLPRIPKMPKGLKARATKIKNFNERLAERKRKIAARISEIAAAKKTVKSGFKKK